MIPKRAAQRKMWGNGRGAIVAGKRSVKRAIAAQITETTYSPTKQGLGSASRVEETLPVLASSQSVPCRAAAFFAAVFVIAGLATADAAHPADAQGRLEAEYTASIA